MEGTQFIQPPPNMPPSLHVPPPNMATPPPNINLPPPNISGHGAPLGPPNMNKYENRQNFNPRSFFRPFQSFGPRGPMGPMTLEDFDGKRLRKSVMRKTVDYNSAIIKALENRVWQRDFRDRRALQPDVMYYPDLMPPPSYPDNAMNCVTTRFVKTATNKMRCPIFCMAWTPEGRRLVTGASSGEFTLWNGLTFNFETILQAHDSPVRTMMWSHNDSWMVTGDHAGYVKYWQSNMNNVKMFQAHKEALRGISFSPMDSKFVTCSDDGTLRIWDFLRCHEERILRGHGADVKCVHWHPQKGLIISGSKDNQQPIKLWDPKTGNSLATLHAHKSTVMDLKWNENGNWLITASRDHLLKLFDLRNLSQEVQTFRGHKKEASSVAWHPVHEGLFSSGGSDGSIMFWHVGADKEVGAIEQAHDSIVWTLAWHPLGHILCSGSNDHTSKFWTRNRPGDLMRDKYNLNTLPAGLAGLEDADIDEPSVIPGMGPEDKVEMSPNFESNSASIPGLDLDVTVAAGEDKQSKLKKVPYSKPIPRNFQAQWNETSGVDDTEDESGNDAINEVISHIVENTPGVVPLQKIEPSAIIVYGKLLPVEPGSKLEKVIAEGPEALKKYIASGAIEELHDVMPHDEDNDYLNDSYEDNDDIPSSSSMAAVDVQLPPPLPSSKLAQVVAQKNQLSLASQLQNLQNQGLTMNLDKSNSDKQRRSRFADMGDQQEQDHHYNMDQDMRPMYAPFSAGCNQQRNADIDLRGGPGGGGGPGAGKVDIRALKQLSQDIDMRQHDDDDMNNDMDDQDMDYRGGGGSGYYEGHGGGFRDQQQGFGNNSNNKFSNNSDPRTQQNQQQWQQNNGSGGQTFTGAADNNFGARGPNFMVNQNGPPYGPPFPNYRPPPHGPPPGFQPNYRPDGPWNGMPRPDSFRGRGGFGPGGPRMPMRGGPRPPRGFPGRGGWMPPPRTNGPSRGRF